MMESLIIIGCTQDNIHNVNMTANLPSISYDISKIYWVRLFINLNCRTFNYFELLFHYLSFNSNCYQINTLYQCWPTGDKLRQ